MPWQYHCSQTFFLIESDWGPPPYSPDLFKSLCRFGDVSVPLAYSILRQFAQNELRDEISQRHSRNSKGRALMNTLLVIKQQVKVQSVKRQQWDEVTMISKANTILKDFQKTFLRLPKRAEYFGCHFKMQYKVRQLSSLFHSLEGFM